MSTVHVFPLIPGEDPQVTARRCIAAYEARERSLDGPIAGAGTVYVRRYGEDDWVAAGQLEDAWQLPPLDADRPITWEPPAGLGGPLTFSIETELDEDTVDLMREVYGIGPARRPPRAPWWRRPLDLVRTLLAA